MILSVVGTTGKHRFDILFFTFVEEEKNLRTRTYILYGVTVLIYTY